MNDAYQCCQNQFHGKIHLILARILKFFNHFLLKKISNFVFRHMSWRIQFFSILFAQTFLSLKSNAKLKVSVKLSFIYYEKGKKGRKTDINFMKCQTFFDSCQIFYHFHFLSNQKVPAARALSSPSGEAAEDNVEEREKFWVGRNYGLLTDYLRTTGDGQTDVEFEIVFQIWKLM